MGRKMGSCEESLDRYFADLNAEPCGLVADEEAALGKRALSGDEDARAKLVSANLRFVISVAKRYRGRGAAMADLVQEGNLGLLKAAETFDPAFGARFITYAAYPVRQHIRSFITEHTGPVRVPAGRASDLAKAARAEAQLCQETGSTPILADIAAAAGLDREALAGLRQTNAPAVAIHTGSAVDDGIAEIQVESPWRADLKTEADDRTAFVEESLALLPSREALILRRFFGINCEPATLEEIGREMGVGRTRVCGLRDKALKRLRYGPNSDSLKTLVA